MGHIKRDMDKSLLLSVMVLLLLLAAVTTYYEITVRKLSIKYNKNQEIFGELTANAIIEESNKTSSIKENVLKYKEHLEKRYDSLNTMNAAFQAEIDNLQAELTLIKSQIEYKKAKDIGPTENFRLFQGKNEEINKLREKVSELCSELASLNISSNGCV